MMKNFFRMIIWLMAMAFLLEIPSAYAIFGIRAARTALAARKAKQMASSSSSSSSASSEAYAQEKARFEKPARTGSTAGSSAAVL